MQKTEQGQVQHYSIHDERGKDPLLLAQTDMTESVPLDATGASLARVISMLSQPLVLIKGRELLFFRFDLRFEAATLKEVSTSATIHPGLLPWLTKPTDFSFPRITDSESGAFYMETTFMNRLLDRTRLPLSRRGALSE